MSPVEIELLVGLFFIGTTLDGVLQRNISAQFVVGVILFILAFLHISLIR